MFMNKTLWQVLIVGAAAEVIMFAALIFKHTLTLGNIANGYLYIFALMLFYLCVLRTFRSYNAALIISLAAAAVTSLDLIYASGAATHLAGALFCGLSFFFYTFNDAKGLKHNQYKHFVFLSLVSFAAALYFSIYAVIMPALIYVYEIVNQRNAKIIILKKRIYFFLLFSFLAIVLNLYGF